MQMHEFKESTHKACESKINLYINILCEHMAMLSVRLTERHHTNAVELYFLFYILLLFINHLTSVKQVKSLTQS